jgi:hypothetical protein
MAGIFVRQGDRDFWDKKAQLSEDAMRLDLS